MILNRAESKNGNEEACRGEFKQVRNVAPHGDRQWHLYDLRTDPAESNDLSKARPDMVKAS